MTKRLILTILALAICYSASAAPAELLSGTMKLLVYPDSGSFSLYQLSKVGKNRYEPLFEDRNSGTTSWFSVLSNGRVFQLLPRAGQKPEVFVEPASIRVVITPTDDFQVTRTFSFQEIAPNSTVSLRIETAIENTSGKTGDFSLKALFDTTLGESYGLHYRTDLRDRISSETSLELSLVRDTWIVSSDADSSLTFDYSAWSPRPSRVMIANWERLKTLAWNPVAVEGRSFNTLYSVNDSALLFIWPTMTLAANKTMNVTMTLSNLDRLSQPNYGNDFASIVDSGGSRNEIIERILARIEEIQRNPDSASDAELQQLNALLDKYLAETGAP